MNIQAVLELISKYKLHFDELHTAEIYKWQITKHFQDHWDIEAYDFYLMIKEALRTSKNLMASGVYYPRRMMYQNAEKNPEEIRGLFVELFDEENDLLGRIAAFQENFGKINDRNYPGTKHFQDARAVMVYLSLKYPNIYYLYKYQMFEAFVGLVDYPYQPRKGKTENITHYLTMCDLLREEIVADPELLRMHQTRIGNSEFPDPANHILTQDLIYAATFHIPRFDIIDARPPAGERLELVSGEFAPVTDEPVLKGTFTNYLELEREKKRIGDLGELLVLEAEQARIKSLGLRREPEQKSKTEGDGLGYDILSFDDKGEELFIEVKTTTAGCSKPFFVTRNELRRSVKDSHKFALYRLFDFDPLNMSAKYNIWRGDLTELCLNPIVYRVVIANQGSKVFAGICHSRKPLGKSGA